MGRSASEPLRATEGRISMQALRRDDLSVRVEAEGVELRTKQVGDLTVAWVRLSGGIDLAPALRGLPGDLCPCPHWGYMLKGRLRMKTPGGDRVFEAGDAFYWGPGHAPEALEDSEYVDFSPTAEFDRVLDHLTSQG
jgi:hypothetical protein